MNPKEMVIYSDMDGTFLTDWTLGPIVPEKNIKAIKKWLSLGGEFSIATGRNLKNVLEFFTDMEIELPMVLVNGALLYSKKENKIIHMEKIPQQFLEEAIVYFKENDHVSLVLSDIDEVYAVEHESEKKPELDFPCQKISLDDIKKLHVLKVTFVVFDEDSDQVLKDLLLFKSIAALNIMPSSKRFIEMVSKKATKALGILKVMEEEKRNLICIGDYLNDLEMLEIADIRAAPINAHERVQKNAHIITVSNNEGAISDLIEQLLMK